MKSTKALNGKALDKAGNVISDIIFGRVHYLGHLDAAEAVIRAYLDSDTAGPSDHAGLVERLKKIASERHTISHDEYGARKALLVMNKLSTALDEAIAALSREPEAGPSDHTGLVRRLETEIKRLDDVPPSIQSQANIRLVNAVREAIAALNHAYLDSDTCTCYFPSDCNGSCRSAAATMVNARMLAALKDAAEFFNEGRVWTRQFSEKIDAIIEDAEAIAALGRAPVAWPGTTVVHEAGPTARRFGTPVTPSAPQPCDHDWKKMTNDLVMWVCSKCKEARPGDQPGYTKPAPEAVAPVEEWNFYQSRKLTVTIDEEGITYAIFDEAADRFVAGKHDADTDFASALKEILSVYATPPAPQPCDHDWKKMTNDLVMWVCSKCKEARPGDQPGYTKPAPQPALALIEAVKQIRAETIEECAKVAKYVGETFLLDMTVKPEWQDDGTWGRIQAVENIVSRLRALANKTAGEKT